MILSEAIILAGGLGTRLRSVVEDKPKALAPVAGRPFLEYLLDYLIAAGIQRCIFSVGYKANHITEQFGNRYRNLEIVYAHETEPLGTGGAIKNAMQFAESDHVLVTNGDSLFLGDLSLQFDFHLKQNAAVTLALRPMQNFSRYGRVETDTIGRITAFKEKEAVAAGMINGGVYIFNRLAFEQLEFPKKFSIEQDYFQAKVAEGKFYGLPSEAYFLDIGIPSDFAKAQEEFTQLTFDQPIEINQGWTLFLDRDGVINRRIIGDYVRSPEQLEILPGALETICWASAHFGRIVIVTNQQGIGKGLMSHADVERVHAHLIAQVEKHGGHIDACYYAPQLASENHPDRKPGPGMGHRAKADFPAIDFAKSIIVGDSPSDLAFGNGLGMKTAFVLTESVSERPPANLYLTHLADLSRYLRSVS